MKIIYIANIIVAGWISVSSLLFPRYAAATVFSGAYPPSEIVRLVGCLWLAIAVLSLLGLWKPIVFSPILLVQLIYKGTWLMVVAIPAIHHHQKYPKGMAIFFLIWVFVLPFFIPWKQWSA